MAKIATGQASYELAITAEAELPGFPRRAEAGRAEEPAVKQLTPATPIPTQKREEIAQNTKPAHGLLKRIWTNLVTPGRTIEEAPAQEPEPKIPRQQSQGTSRRRGRQSRQRGASAVKAERPDARSEPNPGQIGKETTATAQTAEGKNEPRSAANGAEDPSPSDRAKSGERSPRRRSRGRGRRRRSGEERQGEGHRQGDQRGQTDATEEKPCKAVKDNEHPVTAENGQQIPKRQQQSATEKPEPTSATSVIDARPGGEQSPEARVPAGPVMDTDTRSIPDKLKSEGQAASVQPESAPVAAVAPRPTAETEPASATGAQSRVPQAKNSFGPPPDEARSEPAQPTEKPSDIPPQSGNGEPGQGETDQGNPTHHRHNGRHDKEKIAARNGDDEGAPSHLATDKQSNTMTP